MTEHEMGHDHGGGMGHGHPPSGDQPSTHGTHNQMMVGEETVYLSHLPMFDPQFPMHHFQVILEVTLTQPKNAQATYTEDRRSHSDVRMYTMNPNEFHITELDPEDPRRTEITGDVYRGHFERPNRHLLIRGATARVVNTIHFHRFEPGARPLEHLEYLLFGKAPDLFLAHVLVGAPDFDQILGVMLPDGEVSAEDLERGIRVQIPGRANGVRTRIQPGERVTVQAERPGAEGGPLELELEASTEFYFEEGEMRTPMDMRQTAEERKAGF
jgi:hypothetical protein